MYEEGPTVKNDLLIWVLVLCLIGSCVYGAWVGWVLFLPQGVLPQIIAAVVGFAMSGLLSFLLFYKAGEKAEDRLQKESWRELRNEEK
jgi:uncharacterized membrane protein YedE/YeeE